MGNETNNNITPNNSSTVPARTVSPGASFAPSGPSFAPQQSPQQSALMTNQQGSVPTDNGVIDATSNVLESQPTAAVTTDPGGFRSPSTMYNSGSNFANRGTKRKIIAIAAIIFVIMLIIGGLFAASFFKEDKDPTEADSKKTVTNLSNEDLLDVTTESGIGAASKVSINGPLDVNSNLTITPSAQPTNAKAGQIYFDQTNKQFAYFDGQNFQSFVSSTQFNQLSEFARASAGTGLTLAGGSLNNSGVLSLQGQTGDVSFSSGAGIGVNGTTIANTGVLSLQGSVGNVNLTAGSGIALNGLTVTNTGVTALSGTSGEVNVSASSGSIVLSLPQSIAPSAAPTFAGLTLSSALGIGSGGTGSTSYNNNGVIYYDGTRFVSTPTPAAGLCLISNGSGTPVFGSCTGGSTVTSLNSLSGGINLVAGVGVTITTVGNNLEIAAPAAAGVTSLNGANGALTVANSTIAGTVITINDASTSAKGLAQFTASDFGVTGGVVSLGTAVTKQGNSFNGANQLVLLDSSGFLPALNGAALTNLSANNITTGTLSVARGGTGAGSFTLNGVLYGNGTSGIQSTAAGTSGQCLVVNGSGVPVFGACPGAGGVSSVNTKTGAVVIQGGTAIAVDNTGANIVLNNTGVTQLIGATDQVSVSSATGSITLSLPQAIGLTSNVVFNQMTLGQNGSSAGRLVLNGSTSNSVSLIAPASPSSGLTFTLPSADGTANQCLQTNGAGQLSFGTCLGGGSGGGISGSGVANQLAKFTNGQTIGNSNISDDGTVVTVSSGAAIQGSAGLFVGTSGVAGNISLSDGSGNSTSLRAASTGSDLTFVLPNSTGANGQCIKTDGSGNLSFGNCLGGGSGGGVDSITGSAGGSVAASGPITINDASTTGSAITINNASNSVKGIASFSSSSFDVTAGAVTIKNDGVALGTQTSGNYVASIAAGNGIQGSGASEGSTPTIALGPLTSDWNQSGAFDIVLANANAGIRIMANNGTFYGSVDVGNLTADRTYTFPDSSGTVCLTSGNCIGSGGGVSSTGTDGYIALFDGGSYVIADSIISQAGGAINVSGALTATSLQGNGSAITNLDAGNIATGTLAAARGGTGVDASAAANGQLLIGNGAGFSLATLTAGTGIVISNTAGGINISAPDSGTCSGCADSNDVVNSLTGSEGGSAAVKGILTINDALTSGSSITINTASNSVKGIASFSSSFFDVASGAVSIKNDSIALGTNTTGNYVAGVTGGNGLTVTGSGSEGASVGLAINLQANQGLEVDGNGLSLVDCATDQILKYNVSGQWACAADSAGGNGVNAIGTIDSATKSLNGAVVSGSNLILQTADVVRPGLVSTGAQSFAGAKTFSGLVTAASFQGDGAAVANLNAGNVTSGLLDTAYGGTGLNGATAANGQLLIGNGAGFGLATLTQGTGIVITNSAGGITISAPDSGTCSGCADSNDVVNSITGSAGGSVLAKGILTINDALTTGNSITINTATNSVKGIASFDASYFDVTAGAVSIKDDSIALGTKTTGNYVAGVTVGDGLAVTGSGEGAAVNLGLDIQANKGLEADTDGLSLIDCATDQILKYNGSSAWACATDVGVTTVGTIDSQTKSANGAVISGNSLVLQTADITSTGLISATTQTFGGEKTFDGLVNFNTVFIKGKSGQTADMLSIRDNDGEGRVQVKADGVLVVSNNTVSSKVVLATNTGGSYNTFEVTASGILKFGSGVGATPDITLQRVTTPTVSLQANSSLILNGATSNLTVLGTGTSSFGGTLNVVTDIQTNGTVRVTSAGALQNISIAPNSTVKVGTTAGILYTDSSGTIQSLSLTGQNNNCVGLSSVGVVQFQGCSGSGGGLTNFTNGGNSFTNGNGTTATIRLTGNSYNSTITNPVLGLTGSNDLDILTNNISRIRVTSGGNVQILSGSGNSTEQFVVRNLSTGNAATTAYALRVDTSSDNLGRVGIGLLTGNAPQVRLDIGGNSTSTGSTSNGGLQMWASAAPGLSQNASVGTGAIMSGRIYFDEGTGKFKVSENGGGWVDLVQGGGSAPFVNGGNSFGAATSIGTNDSNDLTIKNRNISRIVFDGSNGTTFRNNGYVDFNNESNSGTLLRVDRSSSSVLINTTASSGGSALNVNGSINITNGNAYKYNGSTGSSLSCGSGTQALGSFSFSGGILISGSCQTNNSDLAEAYNNHDGAQPGELVMVSATSATTMERATSAHNSRLSGIISTEPSQTLGTAQVPNGKPVALVGRVPTKVNTEGGAINVGDKITISSVAGVGKKATGRGMVVGTAMESFNGVGTGSVEVYVNTSYYDPTDGANFQADAATFGALNVSGTTTLTNLTVTGNAIFQGNITVNGHIISGGNTPAVTGEAGATATVEGTDTAGTVTVTVTAATPANTVAKVTFSTPFGAAPRVSLTPDNSLAASSKYYTTGRSATSFDIGVGETLQPGTYTFNYQVIQ